MSNDLDLYGAGDLAPYSPSQPLAPMPSPDWNSGTDLLPTQHSPATGGGQLLFGQYPLPPGVGIEQITEAYTRLAGSFVADLMKCGFNISQSQESAQWFLNAIKNPPAKQQPRHRYNLYEHKGDVLFEAYANHAHDRNYPQRFISACCWWVTEAGKRLAAQNVSGTPAHGRAQSKDPTNDLTEAQFDAVVRANDAAMVSTQSYLQSLWGQSYQQNIKLVDSYYQSLPLNEQRALDAYTTGWIRGTNTREVILFLYKQAIGAGTLPSGGGNIQAEINQCEHVMRTNRKAWLNDNQLQARYRELLRMRSGG
ncbi:hypothetical protein NC656_09315 [Pseudomonas asiatica]|uniref:hypothetical protein n=1 Tax=Pseudomonas asiatica TaxID=2219225 RepID=UPI00209C2107|nr:hypothetical protein [Pseudomonas asiatica]MCO8261746.1 hypothetical protein [Pseudomonas asiatica]